MSWITDHLSDKLDETTIHPDNLVKKKPAALEKEIALRDHTIKVIDPKQIGLLRSVTYEFNGQMVTVEWPKLSKTLLSNQICLVTPEGHVLPIIRKGQL